MQPTTTLKQLFLSIIIFFTFLLIGNVLPVPFNYDVIIIIIIFLTIKFLHFMSEIADQFKASLNEIKGKVSKVGTDVTTLHTKLDAAQQAGNGMTADEVTEIAASMKEISDSLGEIDVKTDDPAETTEA